MSDYVNSRRVPAHVDRAGAFGFPTKPKPEENATGASGAKDSVDSFLREAMEIPELATGEERAWGSDPPMDDFLDSIARQTCLRDEPDSARRLEALRF